MSAFQERVAGVRELLEPSDTVTKDEAGAKPLERKPEVLYLYPDAARCRDVPFETGPSVRREFAFIAEYLEETSEEALRERDPETTEDLDDRLERWLDAIRTNRVTTLWHHIQAALRPAPSKLTGRAIAVEISGYWIV